MNTKKVQHPENNANKSKNGAIPVISSIPIKVAMHAARNIGINNPAIPATIPANGEMAKKIINFTKLGTVFLSSLL
jgi:hypothetical protein